MRCAPTGVNRITERSYVVLPRSRSRRASCVPPASQITSHVGHCSTVAADLQRRPARRSRRQRAPRRSELGIVVAPTAATCHASPALLAPHQPRRTAERRQVHEFDLADPMAMRHTTTVTRRPITWHLDQDPQPSRPLADPDHVDIGQANQQRAHPRSIRFQAGAPRIERRRTPPDSQSPCTAPGITPTRSPNPQTRSAR